MLARSARLQIFATKNIVFYNCKFSRQKRSFYIFLQQKRFFTNFATKNCSFLQLHENKHFHGATVISDDLGAHASIGPWTSRLEEDPMTDHSWISNDIYIYLSMQSMFAFFSSFPHGNNIVSQIKKNTNSHIIGVTSISKYHNWIQLKLNHLLIHEAQLGFFSFKPPYCFWVFRLIKPPLIVMIEMPSATAIGLSPEVLVQSSLEQRIGVWQTHVVLETTSFLPPFKFSLLDFISFRLLNM